MNTILDKIEKLWSRRDKQTDEHYSVQPKHELESILNSIKDGVIVADKNGKFLYFNAAAEKILGIGKREVDSVDWAAVYGCYYPDGNTPFPSEQLPLAHALKGNEVNDQLILIRNPERPEGVYISISAKPLNQNGTITGGVVIFNDVTAMKRAEMMHLQSEASFKALFKGIPIPTYVWQKRDDDFVLLDYNNAADILTQHHIHKFVGKSLSEMYPNSSKIIADMHRCYRDKSEVSCELSYQFISTDQIRDLKIRYVFLPSDLVMVHTDDITESKQREKELEKLSNAVEQTADSVIIADKNGIIEYVNPAFEETTGYSREEAVGQKPAILRSGKHDKKFYQELWQTIGSGKPYRGTIINKKKNGTLYWSEQTITPMKDENGQVNHYVSVLKDITDLKKKQEQELQLSIAREIQQRLLHPSPSLPGYDIAGATYPAVETSGDYFDFIPMKNGNLGLVIADVSGHGIGSALIMTATRAYLRAFAKFENDPGIILNWVNKKLCEDLDEINFVTLILARIDPFKNQLNYASAGHVPAYLLDKHGDVKHVLESTGIPLGIMKDHKIEKGKTIQLDPKDMVVFLTDGIAEATSLNDDQFGYARILDFIKHNRKAPAEKIVHKLYTATRKFNQSQHQEDDITSIVCKIIAND